MEVKWHEYFINGIETLEDNSIPLFLRLLPIFRAAKWELSLLRERKGNET